MNSDIIKLSKTVKNEAPDSLFLVEHCRKVHAGMLVKKGLQAFRHVPGLFTHYLKGVLLTMTVAVGVFLLMYFGLYDVFIYPWVESYVESFNKWASWMSYFTAPAAVIVKLVVFTIMVYLSLKASTVVMMLWIDFLIERVMQNFRDLPDLPFSFARMIKVMKAGLKITFNNLMMTFLFMGLGMLPIIGPILAFLGISRSSGLDILSPYLLLLAERQLQLMEEFRFGKRQLIGSGYLQAAVCFLPFVGWLILPSLMLLQVIGFAYFCEEKWQNYESLSAHATS